MIQWHKNVEFLLRALILGFRTLCFRSIPPLFWTPFYYWCLNSYAMLKHGIIAAFDEIWSWQESWRSRKKYIFCKIDVFSWITQKYRNPSIRPQLFWAPVPWAGGMYLSGIGISSCSGRLLPNGVLLPRLSGIPEMWQSSTSWWMPRFPCELVLMLEYLQSVHMPNNALPLLLPWCGRCCVLKRISHQSKACTLGRRYFLNPSIQVRTRESSVTRSTDLLSIYHPLQARGAIHWPHGTYDGSSSVLILHRP